MPEAFHNIFRSAAVAHHAAGRRQGGVLRLVPRWLPWAEGLLAALILAGAVLLGTARVHEDVVVTAVVRHDARRGGPVAVARLPRPRGGALRPGLPVRLQAPDRPWRERGLRLVSVAPDTAGDGTAMLATVRLPADGAPPPGTRVRLVVRTGSRPLLAALRDGGDRPRAGGAP